MNIEEINDLKQQFLTKLQNNPKLKTTLIISAISVVVVLIIVVILLFPLLVSLFRFISENGVQGVIDTIMKGTKN